MVWGDAVGEIRERSCAVWEEGSRAIGGLWEASFGGL